jgi:hypothetical protein
LEAGIEALRQRLGCTVKHLKNDNILPTKHEMRKPTMKNTSVIALCVLGLSASIASDAAPVAIPKATIKQIVATVDGTYGGCAAVLNLPVAYKGMLSTNCKNAWVTLGCDGSLVTKDTALMMLDDVQLALSLSKYITGFVDDSKQINGVCLATRIDLIK